MTMKPGIFALLIFTITSLTIRSQDLRTVETKVADLLAQMPSKDASYTDKLMNDMVSLSEAGIRMICNQVVPAGSGDDTRQRFAVESLSRYLTRKGMEGDRERWEKICLTYVSEKDDYTVKDFFMKQLQLVGGASSVTAMKQYLSDRNLCSPAVAVIGAVGGADAEKVLSEALGDRNLPCAASVMNILAAMRSDMAIDHFISWSSSPDKSVVASAYRAMAYSGHPKAGKVLPKAARSARYRWETTGATESLLLYADALGVKGDKSSMIRICKSLISGCNERSNMQYKTGALEVLVDNLGSESVPYIFEALRHEDKSYRSSALDFSLRLKGSEITRQIIDYYPGAGAEVKPEIISNLGKRKDKTASALVAGSLSDADQKIRIEAASAIVSLEGKESADDLLAYLQAAQDENDLTASVEALKSVLGSGNISLLKPALGKSGTIGKKGVLTLMGWSSDPQFFDIVLPYAETGDDILKPAAIKALVTLSTPDKQSALIGLILKNSDPAQTGDLQNALANAANRIEQPEKRSETILGALKTAPAREKLVPVLGMTGGREALKAVLSEFENGSPEMRSVCFRTLTSWKDYSASSALFEICASGNKTYEGPAFDGYVRQVRSAPVTDEQRLLLYRKIIPCARDGSRKSQVLTEIGKIKTFTALVFVSAYLGDPDAGAAAAKSAMFIALPSAGSDNGMYGPMVRQILTGAVPALKGPESEYDKALITKYLESMPPDEGFVPMFNGKDLSGWQGLVGNPLTRAKMKPSELATKQAEANRKMAENWSVKDGCIYFSGKGDNLCSIREYSDFELLTDWKITRDGDSGIYLRGTPQVQIWDTSRVEVGAQVGSGGLYNNQKNPSKPLKVADNQVGEWNTFRIVMIGEKVSVWLNGILVVDDVVMENYWARELPIFRSGPVELQAHGNELAFRDIYIREINEKDYKLTSGEKAEGFTSLFNGRNLDNWTGNKESYVVEDGVIVIRPDKGSGGNLYTEKEYADFIFRFEFQLTPAANNGLGIRAPLSGDAAYNGMELQILDDSAPVYSKLEPYQYHGSVYGVIPAKRGFLKPAGEWNYQEVVANGSRIKVTLNGNVIVDGDIAEASANGTIDHRDHPGLKNRSGHIGFLGHGSVVKFRNIRIKEITKQ